MGVVPCYGFGAAIFGLTELSAHGCIPSCGFDATIVPLIRCNMPLFISEYLLYDYVSPFLIWQ
jgi:hypothetical protein